MTLAETGQGHHIITLKNCNVQMGSDCRMSVSKSGDSLTDSDMSSLEASDISLSADVNETVSTGSQRQPPTRPDRSRQLNISPNGRSDQIDESPDQRSGQIDVSPNQRSGELDVRPDQRSRQLDVSPHGRSGQLDMGSVGRSGELDISPDGRSGQPHVSPDGRSGQPHISPDGRSGQSDVSRGVGTRLRYASDDIEQGHATLRQEADVSSCASVTHSDHSDTRLKTSIETTSEVSVEETMSTQENLPVEVSETLIVEEGDVEAHGLSEEEESSDEETLLLKPCRCGSVKTDADDGSSLTEDHTGCGLDNVQDRPYGSSLVSVCPTPTGVRLDHHSGLDRSSAHTPVMSGHVQQKLPSSTDLSDVFGDTSVLRSVCPTHSNTSDVHVRDRNNLSNLVQDNTAQSDDSLPQDNTVRSDVSLVQDNSVQSDVSLVQDNTIQSDVSLPQDNTVRSDVSLVQDNTVQSDVSLVQDNTVQSDVSLVQDNTVQSDVSLVQDNTVQSDVSLVQDNTVQSDVTTVQGDVDQSQGDTVVFFVMAAAVAIVAGFFLIRRA